MNQEAHWRRYKVEMPITAKVAWLFVPRRLIPFHIQSVSLDPSSPYMPSGGLAKSSQQRARHQEAAALPALRPNTRAYLLVSASCVYQTFHFLESGDNVEKWNT